MMRSRAAAPGRPTSRPRHVRAAPPAPAALALAALARLAVAALAALALPGSAAAQSEPDGARRPAPPTSARGVPVLRAVPVRGAEPVLDGRLGADEWRGAAVADGFVQYEPEEGTPPSQPTEARILYGEEALFVAFRAWDAAPDSIAGQLTRRDQASFSDRVGVIVDSYFDRRTAFQFAVNPAGVKTDVYHFDDTSEDAGWDAVWHVATSVDAEGWVAEFRIPYSQLRFRDAAEQTWGIQFYREIARHDEVSVWAPASRQDAALVSRMGELRGIRDLDPPRRLEVSPYTLARLTRAPVDDDDPLARRTAAFGTAGADVKYGLTSDLTLDVAINPDFGQVEADPAQVNLTAFETFLPERRPFFVEGSNVYDFRLSVGDGDGANESLFYSRRIGRSPQGSVDTRDGWSDAPRRTTILGAAKVSGKTASGLSLGVLAAATDEERADVVPGEGAPFDAAVEPRTTYAVTRLQQDFRDGRSAVGVVATAVRRDGEGADALELRRAAWTGGVDFRHRFGGDAYSVYGYLVASRVTGSAEAIDRTQRSPARYYQRPDADHLAYDPDRTSLSGLSTSLTLGKVAGAWRWGTGVQSRSPGFESNDAGFMNEADFTSGFVYAGYDRSTPQGPFRRWRLNVNGWSSWSWGWDRYATGGNVNGNFQLTGFWSGYGGVATSGGGTSRGALRGGPALRTESTVSGWGGLSSDGRKPVRAGLSTWWGVRPESDSWWLGLSPDLTFRPSGRARLSAGVVYTRNVDDRQWVGRVTTDRDHHLFGRLDQTTAGLTGRLDYAFTPTLSLQLYAQPFVSAGSFTELKQVDDPRASRYADRFELLDVAGDGEGGYRADLDGDGADESIERPDFDFMQFRSNAVLRWEYRPGSTLFVVWAQGRDRSADGGRFALGDDMGALFDVHPRNVFMVKLSYWLSP